MRIFIQIGQKLTKLVSKITADTNKLLTYSAADPLCRLTKTLYFALSFVKRATYPRISSIKLHLAEKNAVELTMTTTMSTDVAGVNYSLR